MIALALVLTSARTSAERINEQHPSTKVDRVPVAGQHSLLSIFNFYMRRRTGVPETVDSKWSRIAFGIVLLGYTLAGFDWITWIGSPLQQFAAVQLAFVLLSALVGASTKQTSLFLAFGMIVTTTQAGLVLIVPAGSLVAAHLGATLLLVPLLIIPSLRRDITDW